MDKKDNGLSTATKLVPLLVILVSLVTYIYGIGETTKANAHEIARNAYAIERLQTTNEEIKVRLSQIQVDIKGISTDLIWFKENQRR